MTKTTTPPVTVALNRIDTEADRILAWLQGQATHATGEIPLSSDTPDAEWLRHKALHQLAEAGIISNLEGRWALSASGLRRRRAS